MPEAWWNLSFSETARKLGTRPEGLSDEEAARRLDRYGPNELVETARTSPLKIFLRQFLSLMVIILIIAAVISAAIGMVKGEGMEGMYDAIVIMVIVILNAAFGFVQEYKAEKAILALKAMAAPQATVLRNSELALIPARELVPGDLVSLKTGDRIPADCRIKEESNLRVNEASLTGESVPISKHSAPVPGDVIVGDRKNMVHTGTTVEKGRAISIVVTTGMQTELGTIAEMVQTEPDKRAPLQDKLDKMGKQIAIGVLFACLAVFLVGSIRSADYTGMLLVAVSLAVAAIPEGLPAVVTISLALGLQRMAKRHALIRKLPAVEALGSTTVICSDKTGTLTKGEMNIRRVYADGTTFLVSGDGFEPAGKFYKDGEEIDPRKISGLKELITTGILCNDSSLKEEDGHYKVFGDTTEGTLIVLGLRADFDVGKVQEENPRKKDIPFTSERKLMTTIHSVDRERIAHAKGAPERILEKSSRALIHGEIVQMTEEMRNQILELNEQWASEAFRVLALAYRPLPADLKEIDEKTVETDFVFLGMVAMMDLPRKDAIEAIAKSKRAGIRVVMITGDHKLTAEAIAKQMKIAEDDYLVVTGVELEKMSNEELEDQVESIAVYARVSPEHKIRIVSALKERGHVVAMTGDGVNDAPALKRADIGIAMGITGTDVAKEAADMVLTDDNFASIVKATEEGRGIYDNIRKFVAYLLSANVGEVLVMFMATLIFAEPELLPFLIPIQILWINLVTDGLPALALGVDPIPGDIMERKPRDPKENPINREMFFMIVLVGIIMLVGTLGIFQLHRYLGYGVTEARTVAFTTLVMFQLFFVFSVRSPRQPLNLAGFLANPKLILAVLVSASLQLIVVYLPPLHAVFDTASIGILEWVLILLVSSSVIFIIEGYKVVRSRMLDRAASG
ncbi:MAG: calcium-translocating P-type ATPase, SERCA-type [Thermoplasmata archaeon]|nr:calcium-translocating P-type ATPase, SERCA-type [Thermoplasmata archaeon]